MKRVKLTVAYDGTNYCSWQVQANGVSIESELNRHLSELLEEEIHVIGASRTDAGVHALGNVCVFDTHAQMPAGKISYAMNTRLPADIRIQDSREVDRDFHPRRRPTRKTYEYRICNRRMQDPCSRLYSFFYHWDLDVEKMQRGASYLIGPHDFTSFCTNRAETTDHVRTIYALDVSRGLAGREKDMITVTVCGDGFLYNMVRIIVGTLLKIGSGRIRPEEMEKILSAKDRRCAGDTAPPQGLTLLEIEYPEETERFRRRALRT